MGETLADIARHERARGNKSKLGAARCADQVAFFRFGEMIECPAWQGRVTCRG